MNRRRARTLHARLSVAFLLGAFPATANPLPNGFELAKSETRTANPASVGSRFTAEMDGRLMWTFVKIPAGEFDMGCSPNDSECSSEEFPRHHIRVTKEFEIGKYEATQAIWETIMGSNPSRFKGPDRPVDRVSWVNAQEFLRRLNIRNDGYRYRLPTEAEWEYAARAGSIAAHYGDLDSVAWHRGNSQTHPVGQKQPNAWGLYDVEGNVWEWVQDWYAAKYYSHSPSVDPQGATPFAGRVVRGGSWRSRGRAARLSSRALARPTFRSNDLGFRCVREALR